MKYNSIFARSTFIIKVERIVFFHTNVTEVAKGDNSPSLIKQRTYS